MKRSLCLITCLATSLLALPSPGASLTVSTNTDVVDGNTMSMTALAGFRGLDGVISLREALMAADNTASTTNSPNIIYLPAGNYLLSRGELAFGNGTNLNTQIIGLGNPNNTTVRQTDGTNRVFDINFYVLPNVLGTIQNITIAGGTGTAFGGGAILAGGAGNSLVLSNCVIRDNRCINSWNGAGISWGGGGNLTIDSCVISNNIVTNAIGGGICFNNGVGNPGNLTITNSTLVANSVIGGGHAGGLFVSIDGTSSVTVNQSTLLNNSAPQNGGAIYTAGSVLGRVDVQWCRILGNTAGSGSNIYNLSSTVSALNNWWGNNNGPAAGVAGAVYTNYWLKLSLAPQGNPIIGSSTQLRAGFATNSANTGVPPNLLTAFTGVPVTFGNPTNGTLSSMDAAIQSSGYASAQFTPNKSVASANATLDGVTVTSIMNAQCPTITATVSGSTSICAGDSAPVTVNVVGGTPPYVVNMNAGGGFKTNNGSFVYIITPPVTTNCQPLSVIDSNGCFATIVGSALITVAPLPVATMTVPTNAFIGSDGNIASGPAGMTSYAWTITNGVISTATNIQSISFKAGNSGNVGLGLTVTSSGGCSASSWTNIPIVPIPTATITFGNLVQEWDGLGKSVSVTTTPSGLPVLITYNGTSTAPANIGNYTVVATVTATNYQGKATNTLAIIAPVPRIPNPSFESNSFTVFPGYCSGNAAIIGWTSSPATTGLNPASGSPFANNGATPHGNNVAFIQTVNATNSLATTISNLFPGWTYRVTCRVNSRTNYVQPRVWLNLNGNATTPITVPPVGPISTYVGNFGYLTATFTATSNTAPLVLYSGSTGDGALLVDDFQIAIIPDCLWTVTSWTNDASMGVNARDTRFAYRFGAASDVTVNGVTFKSLSGTTPSVGGVFSLTGPNATAANIPNISGNSSEIGKNFIYNGDPVTVTLQGLSVGQAYRFSLFGVGYYQPVARFNLFSAGGDQAYFDENQFGPGNGIRIDYTFVVNSTNNVITIKPAVANTTFHLHAVALNAIPFAMNALYAQTNKFGFTFNGVVNQVIVIEASTNLETPLWIPVQTNVIGTTNKIDFSEPATKQSPRRFYRLRSP